MAVWWQVKVVVVGFGCCGCDGIFGGGVLVSTGFVVVMVVVVVRGCLDSLVVELGF